MSKYKYSKEERRINNVLKYQSGQLEQIKTPDMNDVEARIVESEELLRRLGYGDDVLKIKNAPVSSVPKKVMVVPTWDELCAEAEKMVGDQNALESIFTEDELQANAEAVHVLNAEFNSLHKLDKLDIGISAVAAIVGAAVDILLVGIPQKGAGGLQAGPLSDFIRNKFDEKFPSDEMEKLANSKVSKVPYDAQDNRNTTDYVDGLSGYYHRLLSLGHDPLLGFIFGVFDILTGRMTTIDKTGKIVSQVMENYADRKESDKFAAIAKQINHLKSDVTTSMGLPAPLMGLFNLFQFGSIGEEEQTIADIVQGMYFEGYDFIHFCSLSVPMMLVEVIVRIGYSIKRIKEGHSVKESIPFSLNREKHPKLATMLFIGHSGATAANAGKIYFTKNPLAINYPQWVAFAKYSYIQLKWALIKKSEMRDAYVGGVLYGKCLSMLDEVDETFDEISKDYIVVINGDV
jgi:hypothetical protein